MGEMYSDFLFSELKSIYSGMDSSESEKISYFLNNLIEELMKLHKKAYKRDKKGLLLLKDNVAVLVKKNRIIPRHVLDFIDDLYGLVIEGTNITLVRRFAITRYINESQIYSCSDIERLAYIIITYGAEYIQNGVHPSLVKSMLNALVPAGFNE